MPRDAVGNKFNQIHTSRNFEEVTAQIRRMLVAGDLKPGDRLPAERDLAVQLGVSRNSVREAFRALEIGGLIRLQKGASGGAYIETPTGDVVGMALFDMFQLGTINRDQLTEARIHISEIVVRLAVKRWTNTDIQELRKNMEAAEMAYKSGDFDAASKINLQFHVILARITNNPVFVVIMDGIIKIMEEFVSVIGPPKNRFFIQSRRRFLQHMLDHDADAAVVEMTDLVRRANNHYLVQAGDKKIPASTSKTTN